VVVVVEPSAGVAAGTSAGGGVIAGVSAGAGVFFEQVKPVVKANAINAAATISFMCVILSKKSVGRRYAKWGEISKPFSGLRSGI
jgi:hypothetical protein